ncbi:hypothetical protein ACF1FX_26780 [Streptomyces sp. NPDC014646]|uniref:hypothetical protein n=1 Tax=unclassified Streptomyces TaxID=2593676 RepID=UPI0036FCA224
MATRDPDRHDARPYLGRLLGLLAPKTPDVVAAPHGTDVPVTDVTLHDPGGERGGGARSVAAGVILLSVGVEVARRGRSMCRGTPNGPGPP